MDGKKKEKDDVKDKQKSSVKFKELNATQVECSSHEDHVCDDAPASAVVLPTFLYDDVFLLTHEMSMPMDWVIDSGALFHLMSHRLWFDDYDASRTRTIKIANGHVPCRSMELYQMIPLLSYTMCIMC